MRSFGKTKQLGWAALIAVLVGTWVVSGQNSGDALERGFQNPPDSAKPRVWWHWMNGNITKEGIKARPGMDEARRHRRLPEFRCGAEYAAGGGKAPGLHDAGVEGRLPLRRHAGRPIGPGNGDRRLARMERERRPVGAAGTGDEEVRLERDARGRRPSVHRQASQTAVDHRPVPEPRRRTPRLRAESATPPPEFYADSAVVAYRAPEGDVPLAELQPQGDLQRRLFRPRRTDRRRPRQGDRSAARAGRREGLDSVRVPPGRRSIRGLTLVVAGGGGRGFGRGAGGNSGQALEASDDGRQFRTVAPIPAGGAAKPPSRFQPSPRDSSASTFRTMAASAGRPRRLRRNAEPRPRGACRTRRTRRDPDRRARPASGGPRQPLRGEGGLLHRDRLVRPGDARRACRRRYRAKPMSSI